MEPTNENKHRGGLINSYFKNMIETLEMVEYLLEKSAYKKPIYKGDDEGKVKGVKRFMMEWQRDFNNDNTFIKGDSKE